jgi:dihydropteroate synthase
MKRPLYEWKLRSRSLQLGRRTLVMGILNITPDSFSDGGKFFSHDQAVEHALAMLEEGADILDIGGESTRPGTQVVESAVPAEEELRRIMPVIEQVLRLRPDAILSVDTYKTVVARAAIYGGAQIVNDVSAMRWDPRMAQTAAELQSGVVLMHTRGRPDEWASLEPSPNIVAEVKADLDEWTQIACKNGIAKERIVLDPGFGFGKKFEGDYILLAKFRELQELGFPLLAGTSRKSFIGRTLARAGKDAPPGDRLYGTLATVTASVLQGAHIVRVHDVRPAVDAVRVADEILSRIV